jgi:hypothetical protein
MAGKGSKIVRNEAESLAGVNVLLEEAEEKEVVVRKKRYSTRKTDRTNITFYIGIAMHQIVRDACSTRDIAIQQAMNEAMGLWFKKNGLGTFAPLPLKKVERP